MHLAASAQAVPSQAHPVAQVIVETGAVALKHLDLYPASKPTPSTAWGCCHLSY